MVIYSGPSATLCIDHRLARHGEWMTGAIWHIVTQSARRVHDDICMPLWCTMTSLYTLLDPEAGKEDGGMASAVVEAYQSINQFVYLRRQGPCIKSKKNRQTDRQVHAMNNKHRIKCKRKTTIKSQCIHAFTQATKLLWTLWRHLIQYTVAYC